MTQEEQREHIIQQIANMLRTTQFSVEFAVKKNPKGSRSSTRSLRTKWML